MKEKFKKCIKYMHVETVKTLIYLNLLQFFFISLFHAAALDLYLCDFIYSLFYTVGYKCANSPQNKTVKRENMIREEDHPLCVFRRHIIKHISSIICCSLLKRTAVLQL